MNGVDKKMQEIGIEEWNRRWMVFSQRLIDECDKEIEMILEKYTPMYGGKEVAQ